VNCAQGEQAKEKEGAKLPVALYQRVQSEIDLEDGMAPASSTVISLLQEKAMRQVCLHAMMSLYTFLFLLGYLSASCI